VATVEREKGRKTELPTTGGVIRVWVAYSGLEEESKGYAKRETEGCVRILGGNAIKWGPFHYLL
jgi:hypothetical protein